MSPHYSPGLGVLGTLPMEEGQGLVAEARAKLIPAGAQELGPEGLQTA